MRSLPFSILFAAMFGNSTLSAQARDQLWTNQAEAAQPSALVRVSADSAANPHAPGFPSSLQYPPSDRALVGAAVGSSLAGFVGGAAAGYLVTREFFGCADDCYYHGVYGMVLGAYLGPAVLTPITVHLANRRRGSLSSSYGASLVITALAVGLPFVVPLPLVPVTLFGAPIAHGVSAVKIERRTAEEAAAQGNRR